MIYLGLFVGIICLVLGFLLGYDVGTTVSIYKEDFESDWYVMMAVDLSDTIFGPFTLEEALKRARATYQNDGTVVLRICQYKYLFDYPLEGSKTLELAEFLDNYQTLKGISLV